MGEEMRSPILLACLLAASCGANVVAAADLAAQAQEAVPPPVSNVEMFDDCDGLALLNKEACYAVKPQALIDECERGRVNRCAPYAWFHNLDRNLEHLEAHLIRQARQRYASYEKNQPGYVVELERALVESATTWRAFRDAHCSAEPLIQGMSFNEVADLTEVCRAEMTEVRTKEVSTSISNLVSESRDE